ncbi:MAG: hypothetical protein HUJ54_04605 [Erysipelotrichaceae bacterium]|nr:hypothetical protein [Erysipelotrichaceae bacterium]
MTKWTAEQYARELQERKQTAHDKMWLYIDVNAKEFMEECEPGVKNPEACCQAMTELMLEGDRFLHEPKPLNKPSGKLTVRYFVDNLHPSRRTWAQANHTDQIRIS